MAGISVRGTAVKAILLRTFDSSTLTADYQAINALFVDPNADGLPEACFLLRIVNDSSNGITISYDGINDNEYIRSDDDFELGSQTNSQPNAQETLWAAGTIIYVKGAASAGTITVSGYYAGRV